MNGMLPWLMLSFVVQLSLHLSQNCLFWNNYDNFPCTNRKWDFSHMCKFVHHHRFCEDASHAELKLCNWLTHLLDLACLSTLLFKDALQNYCHCLNSDFTIIHSNSISLCKVQSCWKIMRIIEIFYNRDSFCM